MYQKCYAYCILMVWIYIQNVMVIVLKGLWTDESWVLYFNGLTLCQKAPGYCILNGFNMRQKCDGYSILMVKDESEM